MTTATAPTAVSAMAYGVSMAPSTRPAAARMSPRAMTGTDLTLRTSVTGADLFGTLWRDSSSLRARESSL